MNPQAYNDSDGSQTVYTPVEATSVMHSCVI
jgi:hypothetical protein